MRSRLGASAICYARSDQRRSVGHRAAPPAASLVIAVALANKTALIAWAVMRRAESYRPRVAAAAA
jgi:hypothetical protein